MTEVARVVHRRQKRRRSVGKAYDTAVEVADLIPPDTRLLDVGCGNGYVAHHLNALLTTRVTGVDLPDTAKARIEYFSYDGKRLPVSDSSYDGVLLSYVLHHVQDIHLALGEIQRVVRPDGLVVIYEDVPQTVWDNIPGRLHSAKWQSVSGPCTFRRPSEWSDLFASYGFEIVSERALSRWRNIFHPMAHILYVLRANGKPRASARTRERAVTRN
jgi:ubiquinone/menaquinone biosynthesis C-methylase UbiE